MFPKIKRFKSKENIDQIKSLPCCACGDQGPSDAHHLKSRGSGGGDELENLVPVCRRCHSLAHSMGTKRFLEYFRVLITRTRKKYKLPPINIDRYFN